MLPIQSKKKFSQKKKKRGDKILHSQARSSTDNNYFHEQRHKTDFPKVFFRSWLNS